MLIIHTLTSVTFYFFSFLFSSLCYLHPSSLFYVPLENRVYFNLVGYEDLCASEGVVSLLGGVDVVVWEVGVAQAGTVGVGIDDDIISTSEGWTHC